MINWLHKTTRRGGYAAWRQVRRSPRSFRHGMVTVVVVIAVLAALDLAIALVRAGLLALVRLPAAFQMRLATPSARPGLFAAAGLTLAGVIAAILARWALSRYQRP
jgi:hypothetical protein